MHAPVVSRVHLREPCTSNRRVRDREGGTMDPEGGTFGRCRETVREMTVDREPLAEVEEMLVDTPLTPEEKDALWLFSWALGEQQPPGRRRARRSRDHGRTW